MIASARRGVPTPGADVHATHAMYDYALTWVDLELHREAARREARHRGDS